jgi:HsdM N-terminal domain
LQIQGRAGYRDGSEGSESRICTRCTEAGLRFWRKIATRPSKAQLQRLEAAWWRNHQRKKNGNGANLGSEAQLWPTADKLRSNMEPSDYKHVALVLISLKYISDAFEAKRVELLKLELADAEDPEESLVEKIWVPKEARWSQLQTRSMLATISKNIDASILSIGTKNENLKGVCEGCL